MTIELDDVGRFLSLLAGLDEQQAAVVRMRLGLDPYKMPMSLHEVGKTLNLRRKHVRQLLIDAKKRLEVAMSSAQPCPVPRSHVAGSAAAAGGSLVVRSVPRPVPRSRVKRPAAFGFVDSIAGGTALCRVEVAGTELPVNLSAKLLEKRGLGPGDRFQWRMRDDGSVSARDITKAPPVELSAQEKAEADRLYAGFLEDENPEVDRVVDLVLVSADSR